MLKIIMHGYNGRMGKTIIDLLQNNDECEIVAGIDIYPANPGIPFPTFTNIFECDMPTDVIIDFTTAQAVPSLLEYAVKMQTPVVLCTTGLNEEMLSLVQKASEKVAVLRSANMSVGVNLINNILPKIVEVLADSNFDVEILEKHHNQKIDAPSGTALLIADAVNAAAGGKYDYVYDRSQKREKRSNHEIGFSVVRGGNIVGEHTIIFAGQDEVLEITHRANSKQIFAVGAIKAAKFLAGKPAGLYNMDDVMK